jgi:hypothetical protein
MHGPTRVLVTEDKKYRREFSCLNRDAALWLASFIDEHSTGDVKTELLDDAGNEWVTDRLEVVVLRPKKVATRRFSVLQLANSMEVTGEAPS